MLFWLGPLLSNLWGPLRLLGSHLMLLSIGTVAAGVLVFLMLPRVWNLLPRDRGKALVKDGVQSAGKPTGAGYSMLLLMLPVILLCVPMGFWELGVLANLCLTMFFGYLDDRSSLPWGEGKKGVLDALVALMTAYCLCHGQPVSIWLPIYKHSLILPVWAYLPIATVLLWLSMNATNCSDGIDGLAGSLTLLSLFALAGMLYGVVGYKPIAEYLLVPHNPDGARWAILASIMAGGLAGYLWHNADPSKVMMGDAGSRLLGMLVGVAVLATGNPVLILVVSPVILANGGTGLLKLLLLRLLKKAGVDVTPPSKLTPEISGNQHLVVRALHRIRFPLHDHCRYNLQWSKGQILMRFVLLQAFLIPLLFVLVIKVR